MPSTSRTCFKLEFSPPPPGRDLAAFVLDARGPGAFEADFAAARLDAGGADLRPPLGFAFLRSARTAASAVCLDSLPALSVLARRCVSSMSKLPKTLNYRAQATGSNSRQPGIPPCWSRRPQLEQRFAARRQTTLAPAKPYMGLCRAPAGCAGTKHACCQQISTSDFRALLQGENNLKVLRKHLRNQTQVSLQSLRPSGQSCGSPVARDSRNTLRSLCRGSTTTSCSGAVAVTVMNTS